MEPSASSAIADVTLTRKGEHYAARHRNPAHVQHLAVALTDLRRQAEDEIERLLGFLDRIDGDPDLEPSLGFSANAGDDREGDEADDEPDVDDEDGDTGIADWGGLDAVWGEESALGLLFDGSGAAIGRSQLARLVGGRP